MKLEILQKKILEDESQFSLDDLLAEKSAEQGNAVAYYTLGEMYCDGNGVEIDYEEAFRMYKKAAEKCDKDSQRELGSIYFEGDIVPQDYEEAE